jgi:hypothetical protein
MKCINYGSICRQKNKNKNWSLFVKKNIKNDDSGNLYFSKKAKIFLKKTSSKVQNKIFFFIKQVHIVNCNYH